MWLFTNLNLQEKLGTSKYNTNKFSVYGDFICELEPETNTYWYYYGYLLFRNGLDPKGIALKIKLIMQ